MIAVEPAGKELGPCLRAGQRLWPQPPRFLQTLADGCATQQSGQLTFPILCRLVEKQVITVTDAQITEATRLFWERTKVRQTPLCGVCPNLLNACIVEARDRFHQIEVLCRRLNRKLVEVYRMMRLYPGIT